MILYIKIILQNIEIKNVKNHEEYVINFTRYVSIKYLYEI